MGSIYGTINDIEQSSLYDDLVPTISPEEDLQDRLWKVFYESGQLKKIVDKNIALDEVGTPSDFMQLYFIEMLIRYLCLYQVSINNNFCNAEALAKLKDSFKMKCVRNTMFCKYGQERLFDLFMNEIGDPTRNGIGFMMISGRCNPFIIR